MSKNLAVILVIILLVLGGFAVYTYNQANQISNELKGKTLELESVEEFISELKATIKKKELQIDELRVSLEKEKGDLEQEYINKISALTEEKTKLETSLDEREETIKEINIQKAEVEKDALPKDDLILKLVETIKEKDLQVEELKASLGQEKIAIEKEYKEKLSVLTEEKTKLEAQLIEIRKMLQTRNLEKEELASKLEGYSEQISDLESKLAELKVVEEKDFEGKLLVLTEEKTKLENSLKNTQELVVKRENAIALITQQKEELEKNILEKDKIVVELSSNIEEYKNKIQEMNSQITAQEGKNYEERLTALIEEKTNIENSLKTAQELVVKRENAITLLTQQKEELEENILEKDKLIVNLTSDIEEYKNKIEEMNSETASQEEKLYEEKVSALTALTEEKTKIENSLKTAQELVVKRENAIALITQQKGELEKNILGKDNKIMELSGSIKEYETKIQELKDQIVKEISEKEKECADKLSLLSEKKNKLEMESKTSNILLAEKEKNYISLEGQKETLEKNITEKEKIIIELSESIKAYDKQIQEIREQMAKEGTEKEQEYANKLSLLIKEKNKIEAQLEEAIQKSIPDYYETKRGDSLWKIAEEYYDKGDKWRRIFEANVDVIKNPSVIYPFQRFTIPKE